MIGRVARVLWHNSAFQSSWLDRITRSSCDLASCRRPMARLHNGFSRLMDRRRPGLQSPDVGKEQQTRMTTLAQGFGIEVLDRELGGGLLPGHADRRGRGHGYRQDPARPAVGRRRRQAEGPAGCHLRPDQPRRLAEPRGLCTHAIWLGAATPIPLTSLALVRAGLGLEPAARGSIIIPSSGGPAREPGRPGSRRLARMEGGAGQDPPVLGRVLLSALRPRSPAGRLRRPGADRAVQRIDPVRVLRVHLPPRPAEGQRLGGREWFREQFRANAQRWPGIPTIIAQIGCLYLYTTPHVMLDDLLSQPIGQGDIFSNANTIILMGRTRTTAGWGGPWRSPSIAAAPTARRSAPTGSRDAGLVFD